MKYFKREELKFKNIITKEEFTLDTYIKSKSHKEEDADENYRNWSAEIQIARHAEYDEYLPLTEEATQFCEYWWSEYVELIH